MCVPISLDVGPNLHCRSSDAINLVCMVHEEGAYIVRTGLDFQPFDDRLCHLRVALQKYAVDHRCTYRLVFSGGKSTDIYTVPPVPKHLHADKQT